MSCGAFLLRTGVMTVLLALFAFCSAMANEDSPDKEVVLNGLHGELDGSVNHKGAGEHGESASAVLFPRFVKQSRTAITSNYVFKETRSCLFLQNYTRLIHSHCLMTPVIALSRSWVLLSSI